MEWLSQMNAALDYIEANLDGEILLDEVCRRACCSLYNFQRMFSFITGVPLAEYIRRRKLTAAALDLQNGRKVLETAVRYGYRSGTAFARAFSALHGMNPSDARRPGAHLKAYPRISFQISIQGDEGMDYRMEKTGALSVFGVETVASLSGEAGYLSPAELWQKCHQNGEYERLFEAAGPLPSFLPQNLCRIHGVENYRKTEGNTFPYMLCAFVGEESRTDGFVRVDIPAQTYAVFQSERFPWGEDTGRVIGKLHMQFAQWLSAANYDRVDGANFEIYGGDETLGYLELWFPVTEKQPAEENREHV